uniref:Uncharacterized protein n=1 Tax=Aegilops tauschii subsp. strangulata TaxID=200361 RepID=A0A453HRF6_AEGTS
MELLKGQTKKLRMLEMIQGGSQEHDPEQAQRRKQEYTNDGQGDALGSVTNDGLCLVSDWNLAGAGSVGVERPAKGEKISLALARGGGGGRRAGRGRGSFREQLAV